MFICTLVDVLHSVAMFGCLLFLANPLSSTAARAFILLRNYAFNVSFSYFGCLGGVALSCRLGSGTQPNLEKVRLLK